MKDFVSEVGLKTLSWPGNSPDLNPIENCWSLLKLKIAKKNSRMKEEFKSAIKDSWKNDISLEYCRNLISSMPRRIEAVIKARGGHTKY